jgi:hypothetical protein
LKAVGEGLEGPVEVVRSDIEFGRIKLHPHEKQIGTFIGMFVRMQDVAIVLVNEIRNAGDDPLRVGATEQKNAGGFHGSKVNSG